MRSLLIGHGRELDMTDIARTCRAGRMLFFDPRLTIDANVSCSSCHQPAFYGTDARPRAIGVKQRPHPRNAPTVLNTGVLNIIHWHGDRDSLEDQATKAANLPDHIRPALREGGDRVSFTDCRLSPHCSKVHFRMNRSRSRYRTLPKRSAPMSARC